MCIRDRKGEVNEPAARENHRFILPLEPGRRSGRRKQFHYQPENPIKQICRRTWASEYPILCRRRIFGNQLPKAGVSGCLLYTSRDWTSGLSTNITTWQRTGTRWQRNIMRGWITMLLIVFSAATVTAAVQMCIRDRFAYLAAKRIHKIPLTVLAGE